MARNAIKNVITFVDITQRKRQQDHLEARLCRSALAEACLAACFLARDPVATDQVRRNIPRPQELKPSTAGRVPAPCHPNIRCPMYHHIKKLMYTVRVDEPDPRFGNMLLEQFGGANGELAAAMQYSVQGLNCEDPGRKDMLMDIGTEELSHLEIVGTLARMHLKPLKSVREEAEVDP